MRVVIDARMLGWTGIGRYTKNLLDNLQQIDRQNDYFVLLSDTKAWQPSADNFTSVIANYKPYGLAEQLIMPLKLLTLKPDLVHFPHFTAPLLYFGKYVITLHDLTLVHFKNVRGGALARLVYETKYWLMRGILRNALYGAAHIITDTEFVKNDVLQSYRPRLRRDKITPTPLAVEQKLITKHSTAPGINRPFLLHVGNSYPNKNLHALISAFTIVAQTSPDLSLVLVGQEDYFYAQLREQVEKSDLKGKVHFPGRVPDDQLSFLYKNAEAFVFPSLSEGFGLPPLEAMAYGTPVISSNASCMPEVLGDAATYFDPTDVNDMATKISALLDDKKELARLRQAGPGRVKLFSWKKMAKQTLAVYQKTLGA